MKISYDELKGEFLRVLKGHGVPEELAVPCATEFADTTAYGVLSHGINRFPVFISQLDKGDVKPLCNPQKVSAMQAVECWDGQRGIGNLTAKKMMDRACEIAGQFGAGIVALRNTNHWMRGGSYGWQGAKKGFISMCWTNSIAVMPAWGTKECCIGTNPLIIGVPTTPVTLVDMSMSMFSYGKLQTYRLAGKKLPIDGGFDDEGRLTREPGVIEKNKRILPMGYWKGSGLSIVLDLIGTILSDGLSVAAVTKQGRETGVTQIFIAVSCPKSPAASPLAEKLKESIDFILNAAPDESGAKTHIPGHNLEKRYADSLKNGMEVNEGILKTIRAL